MGGCFWEEHTWWGVHKWWFDEFLKELFRNLGVWNVWLLRGWWGECPVAKEKKFGTFFSLNFNPWISRYDVDFHQEPMRFDHAALESWKRTLEKQNWRGMCICYWKSMMQKLGARNNRCIFEVFFLYVCILFVFSPGWNSKMMPFSWRGKRRTQFSLPKGS